MQIENPDWSEKYRPRKVDDVILPKKYKEIFSGIVKNGNIPNLLLCGTSGVGKTTIAKAMMDELDVDYIVINGSLEGNIETLRNKISNFASSVSFKGGKKMVLIDEADWLNIQSFQPALRNFIQTYSINCGFIFTCNYKKRIMPELLSRCTVIDFSIKKAERPSIAIGYLNKLTEILDNEKIEYDKHILADIITRNFPDFRKVINECQTYSNRNGKIDNGILGDELDINFSKLIESLKKKDFRTMRKWVSDNYDADPIAVMRKIYDESYTLIKPNSIPEIVVILADYQYKHAFVMDQEINLVACLSEIMAVALWN